LYLPLIVDFLTCNQESTWYKLPLSLS